MEGIKKPVYQRTWFVVLFLFIFAPVGIWLLWKYEKFNILPRMILSIVSIIFFVYCVFDYRFGDKTKDESVLLNSQNTTQEVVENKKEETKEPIAKTQDSPTTDPAQAQPAPELVMAPIPEPAPTPEPVVASEPIVEPTPEPVVAPEATQGITVYKTTSGEKYHLDGCQHLKKSKIAINLTESTKSLSPCKDCNPPAQ